MEITSSGSLLYIDRNGFVDGWQKAGLLMKFSNEVITIKYKSKTVVTITPGTIVQLPAHTSMSDLFNKLMALKRS